MSTFHVRDGLSLAVWQDKYARTKPDGSLQSWEERITEVTEGNTELSLRLRGTPVPAAEKEAMLRLMRAGVLPMSGRHLQQGDIDQHSRLGELFTNCSTAAFSFIKFWLLMKGSGVGRLYDQDICLVDWSRMPTMLLCLSPEHPDWDKDLYDHSVINPLQAKHLRTTKPRTRIFHVPDSAEGWAYVVQVLEAAAWEGSYRDYTFIFDFTLVRPEGSPIRGQQNRPASGPVPFMKSLMRMQDIARHPDYDRWEQALRIDHELASCVIVGGIRRSARIAVKSWDDPGILRFISIKQDGDLWSANNSIAVDAAFWRLVQLSAHNLLDPDHVGDAQGFWLAMEVFSSAVEAAYEHGTGEPGFINADRLSVTTEGVSTDAANYLHPVLLRELGVEDVGRQFITATLKSALSHRTTAIVNPCGEIPLAPWGGYCVIGDVCMANTTCEEEAIEAAVLCAKALVRVNLLPFLYAGEVARTNRIGVSLTGLHEFAYQALGLTWGDLVGDLTENAERFWMLLQRMREAIKSALQVYCAELGVSMPHSFTTIKPSGTVSKVMWCTEGAHLPPYAYYMRWVLFPTKSPMLAELRERGYPVKDVSHQYTDHHVVGFPTRTRAAELLGDDIVLAGDATIPEQYTWLQRLEEYWLGPQGEGGQVSYTLKYNPSVVSRRAYMDMVLQYQSTVRCCAMMPQVDLSAYAYQPEEAISAAQYKTYTAGIDAARKESYDANSLQCDGGACPIELDLR